MHLVERELGARGAERLRDFRNLHSEPWGEEGKGKPVSPQVLEGFYRFLENIEFSTEGKRPSLFLTDEGHLELFWEDAQGGAIQVEFGPCSSEIYVEKTGVEEEVSNEWIPEVARRLTGI